MNLPVATIIGTRMPIEDISKYLGYIPGSMNTEFTRIIREICISRGYLKKTMANKMKLYRIVEHDIGSLTDGKQVMLETLKSGNSWNPDIAFLFSDYKNAEVLVNSKYPFGNMDSATRIKYIDDLNQALGDKLFKVDLLN
jgi:hypothetical protein